jgi:carbamoyl-phosphate synthase small subunit
MKLFLEDGTAYEGESFGAKVETGGEAVFATGLTGYVESLTDPSFAGQILVCTYPLIGNYGVPSPDKFESSKIHVAGLVVSEYSEEYSHADAKQSLAAWLKAEGVPAITGVDTRAITKRLRERGVMLAHLGEKQPRHYEDPNRENLVAHVSPREIRIYGSGPVKITLVDCGVKENIIRSLLRPGITLKRVPWDYDFTDDDYHALVLGNGPGDPEMCVATIHHIGLAMRREKPILGVCLGNQLLALAAGGSTYKLKYGHRSHNQPCIDKIGRASIPESQDRCYITSQNHGFAVDASTLGHGWQVWFENANDGSVEGIRHATKPWRSVQFHPEAAPGPTDTAWIFDEFLAELPKRLRI